LGINQILSARNETECADTAAEDWNRLFGIWRLAQAPSRTENQKEEQKKECRLSG